MRRDAEAAAAEKEKRKGKKWQKEEDIIDLGVGEDDVPLTSMKKKKPRIKINLRGAIPVKDEKMNGISADEGADQKKKPIASRQKRTRRSAVGTSESASEATPKKIVRKRTGKQKTTKSNGEDYLDVGLLKKERENLGGNLSFDESRNFFTKRGPWILPAPLKPETFRDVAMAIFKKIDKIDRYDVFAEPVSDNDAPDYSDIVKSPIDLSTMNSKLESGVYGEGSDGASKLYSDYLLMFDNCRLYNEDDGEVTEEAARIMALIPEIYAGACVAVRKKQK
eukprot:jgi/Psemu1/300001/fgenesh1_kg.5_\